MLIIEPSLSDRRLPALIDPPHLTPVVFKILPACTPRLAVAHTVAKRNDSMRAKPLATCWTLCVLALFVASSKADEPAPLTLEQAKEIATRGSQAAKAVETTRQQISTLSETLTKLAAEVDQAKAQLESAQAALIEQQAALKTASEQEEAALKVLTDEAQARRDAVAKVVAERAEVLKTNTAELVKKKAELTQAENGVKESEKKLTEMQAAAKKAADEKATMEAAATEATKAAAAAAEAAKAAADAATAAQEKAAAAAKAAEQAAATVQATEQQIAALKDTITKAPEGIKQAETQFEQAKASMTEAETQLAAITSEAVNSRKALESNLIAAGKLVSFADKVAPIFAQRCVACHNARIAKGRLNLESFAALKKGGESGEAVTPGDPDVSNLFIMISDGSMPQDADPLTPEETETIHKWIETGATLDAGIEQGSPLIAIMPKVKQPSPPDAYRVPIPVTALAYNPEGSLLASSGYHEVLLWNAQDGSLARRITNVSERVYDVEFSPDGKILAVAAGTPAQIGELKLFDVASGKLLGDLVRTDDALFTVAFSPDGTRVAGAGADRAIRVYEVATGAEQLSIEDHADWVLDVAWTPDGTKLASASRDKTAKVFDMKTGDSLVTFNGHGEPLFGVAITPDGNQVITGGRDKKIRIWNVSDAAQVREIGGFGDEVFRLTVTSAGQILASSADKTARAFNLADGAAVRTFSGHTDWVYSIAAHPGTHKVASGSYDGEIRVWNADDGAGTLNFVAAPGYLTGTATAVASP